MYKEMKTCLTLDGEMDKRFLQIKEHLGLKNDMEVARSLIYWHWRQHEKEFVPPFEHFNLEENGACILNREFNRIIQVCFKPDKILCEYFMTGECKHVEFALGPSEVQETLRKRRWFIEK